ncbi:excisionase family DNA-binding protein [Streptomyces sp. CB01881]|uniref:excisionase family DNA-binding protein n=1 Tax=Streptomyces sp. CB01881 TaxID=2078691 RepID=UPI000CDBAEB0|nr:excisionase family DNA-binding protein [Streptomyces sp. CB01881]AUY49746.1 DNA-binding protein [Streptomyces sp. CB01881]TYC73136.1 DNA-binding protein [Streptomyces sp. CB01881]
MATTTQGRKLEPGVIKAQDAKRALRRINEYLSLTEGSNEDIQVHLEIGAQDEALILPRPAAELIAAMLAALASGKGVQIMPLDTELTTQQAADILNVSRPYLIGLLDDGKIQYRRVGRHRRIRVEDLMRFKREDDQRRHDAANELAQLGQDLGLD